VDDCSERKLRDLLIPFHWHCISLSALPPGPKCPNINILKLPVRELQKKKKKKKEK